MIKQLFYNGVPLQQVESAFQLNLALTGYLFYCQSIGVECDISLFSVSELQSGSYFDSEITKKLESEGFGIMKMFGVEATRPDIAPVVAQLSQGM